MNKIYTYIAALPLSFKIILLTFFLLSLFSLIYFVTLFTINSYTKEYSVALRSGDVIRQNDIDSLSNYLSSVDTSKQFQRKVKTISKQYSIIANERGAVFSVARTYYNLYYAVSFSLIVASILTAIIVFFIANTGWSTASLTLKTLFFTLFFISSLLGLVLSTLSLKDNFQNNLNQEALYRKLENKIYTYLNSCDSLSVKDDVRIKTTIGFISDINKSLDDNYKFFIDIKSQDAYNQISNDLSGKLNQKKS